MEENSLYYKTIKKELEVWEKKMTRRPRLINKASKKLQSKFHNLMPQKAQDVITISIKTMVQTVMFGSSLLTKSEISNNTSISEGDFLAEKAYKMYYKVAIMQGIGFGLGGFLINLADLPALLSLKVKFLFDIAKSYGFDVNKKEERIFLLYVFQLAFSCDEYKKEIFYTIKGWDNNLGEMELNWEKLQMEYRDYLDIAKLLQLLPVVGAVAGAYANHNLMQTLKVTAVNAYRLRLLQKFDI